MDCLTAIVLMMLIGSPMLLIIGLVNLARFIERKIAEHSARRNSSTTRSWR